MKDYKKELQTIKEEHNVDSLKYGVIVDILDHAETSEEVVDYINSVIESGCVNGAVSSLVYYEDTRKFYIKYMEEIDELISETGITIEETPRYNWAAWFAYEETIYQLSMALGIE